MFQGYHTVSPEGAELGEVMPFQGAYGMGRLKRRALPYAVKLKAFSQNYVCFFIKNLSHQKSLLKLSRSAAFDFLEQSDEMLRILETKGICDFADILFSVDKFGFGQTDYFVLDIFLGCFTCLFFYQVAEIAGGKTDFVGKIFY